MSITVPYCPECGYDDYNREIIDGDGDYELTKFICAACEHTILEAWVFNDSLMDRPTQNPIPRAALEAVIAELRDKEINAYNQALLFEPHHGPKHGIVMYHNGARHAYNEAILTIQSLLSQETPS